MNSVFDGMMDRAEEIPGLGPNVATEILNTLDPLRYPILNANPLTSLRRLGVQLRGVGSIRRRGERYQSYADTLEDLAVKCRFQDLAQVDHFLNYIFHRIIRA
jgi:hypothetical protein